MQQEDNLITNNTQYTEETPEFDATIMFEDIATPAAANYKTEVEDLMVPEPQPDQESPYKEGEDSMMVALEVVPEPPKILRRFQTVIRREFDIQSYSAFTSPKFISAYKGWHN